MRLLFHRITAQLHPYPVLHPPSFTVWFPKKSPQISLQTLFSKEFQVQYAFVTSFFKGQLQKYQKSQQLKNCHVSTSDFFLRR